MSLAAVAGGLGGIAAAGLGVYAAKQQEDLAKKGMAQQKELSAVGKADREAISQQVKGEVSLATDQVYAAEQARLQVGSMLGRAGTYGSAPGGNAFGISPKGIYGISTPGAGSDPFGRTDASKGGTVTGTGKLDRKTGIRGGTQNWEVEGSAHDPTAIAAAVTSQPQFAAVSQMVAEANQLANREGPLWEEMNQSTVGAIFEGAAAAQRQVMDTLSREAARGGGARSRALASAKRMQAQENINRARTGELWQARIGLEELRSKQIKSNISFANSWMDNQAGIRDNFTSTLTSLRTMWSTTMAPAALGVDVQAQALASNALTHGNDALMDANASKFQAIAGGLESLVGLVGSVGSSVQSNRSGGIG
jgi:hypothetical protein